MRKRFLRALTLWVAPLVGALLIRLIYWTNKKRYHLPEALPAEPVIFVFWHGDILMEPYNYLKMRRTPKIKLLISEHFDGEVIAKTTSFFNFEVLRGSSRKGGAKVLIQAIRALSEGYDIGVTPDGPKGPRYSFSDGAVVMAQKRNARIVVLNCVPTRYWQMGSWDRFMIPKPFGTLMFYASEPIDVSGMEIETAKALVREKLMEHAL